MQLSHLLPIYHYLHPLELDILPQSQVSILHLSVVILYLQRQLASLHAQLLRLILRLWKRLQSPHR